MTLEQLLDPNFNGALMRLSRMQLPMDTAWRLRKILKATQKEQNQYQEMRSELLAQYAEKQENGEIKTTVTNALEVVAVFSPDNEESFRQKTSELLKAEVDIPKLKAEMLPKDLMIAAFDLVALDPILEIT